MIDVEYSSHRAAVKFWNMPSRLGGKPLGNVVSVGN